MKTELRKLLESWKRLKRIEKVLLVLSLLICAVVAASVMEKLRSEDAVSAAGTPVASYTRYCLTEDTFLRMHPYPEDEDGIWLAKGAEVGLTTWQNNSWREVEYLAAGQVFSGYVPLQAVKECGGGE